MIETKPSTTPQPATPSGPPFEIEDLTRPEVQQDLREFALLQAWVEQERARGNLPN